MYPSLGKLLQKFLVLLTKCLKMIFNKTIISNIYNNILFLYERLRPIHVIYHSNIGGLVRKSDHMRHACLMTSTWIMTFLFVILKRSFHTIFLKVNLDYCRFLESLLQFVIMRKSNLNFWGDLQIIQELMHHAYIK